MQKRRRAILSLLLILIPAVATAADILTLSEGLKLVTAENRVIRIKEQETQMTREDSAIARSALLPKLSGSYTQTFLKYQPGANFGLVSVNTSERDFYVYSVKLQQLLYDFGGAFSLYRSARLGEELKALDMVAAKNVIALDFTTLYFDVLESEKLVMVAEKEIESLEGHAKIASELFDTGVITKNDLLQAEVRLSDARQKLLTAKNGRKINGVRLNSIITRPLATEVAVTDITRPLAEAVPWERAVETAEKKRPEFRMADTTLRIIGYQEKAQKSAYFPRIFAQGDYDFTKNKYLTHDENWGLSLGMSIDFFNGGSTRAEVEKLKLAATRLRIERKKLEDDIQLQLERYRLDIINANDRIRVTRGAIEQAEENLRIARLKYSEGVGIATDVTDAITLRTLSETNYYRALYDYYRAEAGYLYAMGMNLEEEYK